MSTKALKSQLLAAVAMVLVSSIALGSSTFAWFAINNRVTVTGPSFTTQVQDNLFIADTADGSAKLAASFNKIPAEKYFTTAAVLAQPSEAKILEPVSSANGQNFFYNKTNNTLASGERASALVDYVAYVADQNFDVNYGFPSDGAQDCVGYVDYAFALKAINTDPTNKKYINLKNLTLTYAGATDTNRAFRTAFFVEKATGTGANDGSNYTVAETATALNSIKSEKAAVYFDDKNAVTANNARGKVTNLNAATAIPVAANSTEYFKVIVRIWIEGEDDTCNNSTFMSLKDKWNLDMKLQLENAEANDDAAKYITHGATGTKKEITGTSADVAAYTIDGVSYYKVATVGDVDYYLTAKSVAYDGTQSVYTIESGAYVKDVTNQVTLGT